MIALAHIYHYDIFSLEMLRHIRRYWKDLLLVTDPQERYRNDRFNLLTIYVVAVLQDTQEYKNSPYYVPQVNEKVFKLSFLTEREMGFLLSCCVLEKNLSLFIFILHQGSLALWQFRHCLLMKELPLIRCYCRDYDLDLELFALLRENGSLQEWRRKYPAEILVLRYFSYLMAGLEPFEDAQRSLCQCAIMLALYYPNESLFLQVLHTRRLSHNTCIGSSLHWIPAFFEFRRLYSPLHFSTGESIALFYERALQLGTHLLPISSLAPELEELIYSPFRTRFHNVWLTLLSFCSDLIGQPVSLFHQASRTFISQVDAIAPHSNDSPNIFLQYDKVVTENQKRIFGYMREIVGIPFILAQEIMRQLPLHYTKEKKNLRPFYREM